MEDELKDFCEDIVKCLVKYGGLEESAARNLVLSSKICVVETEMRVNLLFHETPYYWAMHLLHPNNPQWHQDRRLWPPPKDYLDKSKW